MKRKIIATVLAAGMTCSVGMAAVGCGGGEKMVTSSDTLNVKIHAAGYGTTYITALKEKFEEAYAEEGYKINVLAPDALISNELVYTDIYSSEKGKGVDIYITGCNAEDAVTGDYGQVIVDITDTVMNQKALTGTGEEESKTVLQKMNGFSIGKAAEYNGRHYGMPMARSTSGYAVNVRVLNDLGLEIPLTTNDLSNCIDVIMKQSALDITNKAPWQIVLRPFTYSTDGKNNYGIGAANMFFIQTNGMDFWKKFWGFMDGDREMVEDCYEVFKSEYTVDMFASMFEIYDSAIAVNNYSSQTFIEAQNELMQGNAVFCPTGDWFLNEEIATYPDKVKDITFMKIPVTSSLGEKLFGAEKGEAILKAIIKGVDANKDVATIESEVEAALSVSLDTADVERVCEARGYTGDSSGECAYISAKSTKQELAATFLRFMAGDDGAAIYSAHTRTTSPFSIGKLVEDENIPWYKAVNDIFNNQHCIPVKSGATDYRERLGVTDMFFQKFYLANKISVEEFNLFNPKTCRPTDSAQYGTAAARRAAYRTKAQSYADAIYKDAKACVENNTWKL